MIWPAAIMKFTSSWKKDPMSFWAEAAKEIDWIKPPKTVFDPQAGVYGRWFPDGTLNTCYNALDRHVIKAAPIRPR